MEKKIHFSIQMNIMYVYHYTYIIWAGTLIIHNPPSLKYFSSIKEEDLERRNKIYLWNFCVINKKSRPTCVSSFS